MNDLKRAKLDKIINWAINVPFHPADVSNRAIDALFMQSAQGNDAVMRSLSHFAWEMYHGTQLKYLVPNPAETEAEFQRRQGKGFLNLTRLLVNVLASLYKNAPTRSIEASERLRKRAEQLYDGAKVDNVMLTADRYAKLQGTCAIRPVFLHGKMFYHVYPAHSFRVQTLPEKPWEPSVLATYHDVETGSGAKVQIIRIWTDRHFLQLENKKPTKFINHDIGRLPFTFVRDYNQPTSFWIQPQGAEIAYQNRRINAKISDLAYTVKMQGFGVLEVVNPDPSQEIVIAPNRAIQFRVMDNEPYGINFKHPNAPIADLIDDIKFDIEQMLLTYRIPESAITVHLSKASSGVAIVAAQTPLHEILQERANLFRMYESDLLDCAMRVLAKSDKTMDEMTRREISGGKFNLRVDFPKPELNLSHSDKLASLEFKLKHNLITPWELMYKENPDGFADEDAAKEHYLRNLEGLKIADSQESAKSTVQSE